MTGEGRESNGQMGEERKVVESSGERMRIRKSPPWNILSSPPVYD